MTKTLLAIAAFLLVSVTSHSQLFKSVLPTAGFNEALEDIVSDFRYNYQHIKGEQLASEGAADAYKSTVILPGAEQCSIYMYHSVEDTTASWQGLLYQGEDYEKASNIYRNTFKQLNRSRMQLIDKSVIGFSGKLEEPAENVKFAVSTLYLDIADHRYERFAAEIEMIAHYDGWQVTINFFNKKPDNARE